MAGRRAGRLIVSLRGLLSMSSRVQDKAPPRSPEMQQWLDDNIAHQAARYEAIVREMEELEPERATWYQEFLEIVQTKGFHVTGDITRRIRPDELPEEPDRKHRVVF